MSDNFEIAGVEVTVAATTYSATLLTVTTWSVEITEGLSPGSYDVNAVATDTAGNTGTDATTDELTIWSPTDPSAVNRSRWLLYE